MRLKRNAAIQNPTSVSSAKKYASVEELRSVVTNEQRAILSEILRFKLEENKVVSAIHLYNKFGKTAVDSSLDRLGGSVIYRVSNYETGRKYYHLTFLGILLTDRGLQAQELLERYLNYLRERLKSEPDLSAVTDQSIRFGLRVTAEEFDFFRTVLGTSPFWNGSGYSDSVLNLPRDVDVLSAADDIPNFLQEHALDNYDENRPLDWNPTQGLVRAAVEEEAEPVRAPALSIGKLSVLGLGAYLLYFLYVVCSEVGQRGYLEAFAYRSIWGRAVLSTSWLLIVIFAALLLVGVLGPERFSQVFPGTRRLLLLPPIDTEVSTVSSSSDAQKEASSQETNFGFQLYLDYNESIKKVYNNAILQYRNSFYLSLIFAIVGFGIIFYTLVFRNGGNTSWPAVVVSAVIEAVPALFFYLSDKARKQMINVFVDLRRDNEIARAYEVLRTLKNSDRLEALKEEIVRDTLLKARAQSGDVSHGR